MLLCCHCVRLCSLCSFMHWINTSQYLNISLAYLEFLCLFYFIWKRLSDLFPFALPAHVFNESKPTDCSFDFCISARISLYDFCKVAHWTQLNGNQSLLPVTFLRSQEGEGRKKIKVELGCIMLATKGNAYRELKSEVSQGKYLYHKLDWTKLPKLKMESGIMKKETHQMIGKNIFLTAAQLPVIIKCVPQAEPDPAWHTLDSYTSTSVTGCDWSCNRAGLEKTGRVVVWKMHIFVFLKSHNVLHQNLIYSNQQIWRMSIFVFLSNVNVVNNDAYSATLGCYFLSAA